MIQTVELSKSQDILIVTLPVRDMSPGLIQGFLEESRANLLKTLGEGIKIVMIPETGDWDAATKTTFTILKIKE